LTVHHTDILDHDSACCRARHLKDVIVGLQKKKDRNLESKWINLHICCLVIKFVSFEGNNVMDHRPKRNQNRREEESTNCIQILVNNSVNNAKSKDNSGQPWRATYKLPSRKKVSEDVHWERKTSHLENRTIAYTCIRNMICKRTVSYIATTNVQYHWKV
jgi:hypothetical protein